MASGSGSAPLSSIDDRGERVQARDKISPKNSYGLRTDVAWEHGVSVDGSSRNIQCKYCLNVYKGGTTRFKHHLAGIGNDARACNVVPDDVKMKIYKILHDFNTKKLKKENTTKYNGDRGVQISESGKRKCDELVEGPSEASATRAKRSIQSNHNNTFNKCLTEDACLDIASFFYNNEIPFTAVKSEEFTKMCESISRHGLGFKPPSFHDLRGKLLKKKVEMTHKVLDEHKASWRKTGCTITTDGWTDRRRRMTILNFFVNSPKGTVFLKSIDASSICKTSEKIFQIVDEVVEEVGEENVIQVITDNAANYKAAGELLMQKRKRLYWTPCAAHCINLMLKDFEKKLPLHKEAIAQGKKITTYIYSTVGLKTLLHQFTGGADLIRPGTTQSASSYLTLGCLQDKRGALIKMFADLQWKNSQFAKTKMGKDIEKLIIEKGFWNDVLNCLRGAY
ncbi:uncharacterized protein LOC130727307, partial [Lotus japonicus]|uniref:uncharacterized protein LOC130727307 n=1 Tax=Lotus japonicus TaxID=34305 RepID=UPI002589E4C0